MTDRHTLPALYSPFPRRMSPHFSAASEHAAGWVERLCLFPDEGARRRFIAMDIPRLSAMAYPSCSAAALELATDWCVWLFAWDDRCDRTPIGRSPGELSRAHAEYRAILAGAGPDSAAPPLSHALADLRDRMLAMSDPSFFERFAARVEDYFRGCVWEAENRARSVVPERRSYVTMRPACGAVDTAFELFALTDGAGPPGPARERFAELERAANNVICWANDILSVHRELASGDVHNLVIILMHEERLSLGDALVRAARMHDAEVRRYQEIERRLALDGAVSHRCSLIRAWIAANQEWSLSTSRYRAAHQDLVTP